MMLKANMVNIAEQRWGPPTFNWFKGDVLSLLYLIDQFWVGHKVKAQYVTQSTKVCVVAEEMKLHPEAVQLMLWGYSRFLSSFPFGWPNHVTTPEMS